VAERLPDRAPHDVDAEALLRADPDAVEGGLAADEGHAAAGDDALFDGRTRRASRPRPALSFISTGRAPTLITATPPTSFANRSCSFAVVVRRRLLDLVADLPIRPRCRPLAGAIDERRVVLVDRDTLRAPHVLQGDVLELDAELLGDRGRP
jgi:hypothetical protein